MRAGQRPAEPLCAWAASHQTCGADSSLPLFLVEHGWSESTSRKPDACRGFWKTLQGRVAVSAPCLGGRAAQEVSGLTGRGTWTNLGRPQHQPFLASPNLQPAGPRGARLTTRNWGVEQLIAVCCGAAKPRTCRVAQPWHWSESSKQTESGGYLPPPPPELLVQRFP